MLFWSCLVKIFLGTRSMLLRLYYFPGNQIHWGINDNPFLLHACYQFTSLACTPCACTAERRGRLLARLLRRVRRSRQEQRCPRSPAKGGGFGPCAGTAGASGCRTRRGRAPAALGRGTELLWRAAPGKCRADGQHWCGRLGTPASGEGPLALR